MTGFRARSAKGLRVVGLLLLLVGQLRFSVPAAAASFAPTATPPLVDVSNTTDTPYVPGEVVIGWRDSAGFATARVPMIGLREDRADPAWQAGVSRLSAAAGLPVLEAYLSQGRARLFVPPGHEREEIARLKRLPWVAYAEPNHRAYAAYVPTDLRYSEQWGLPLVSAPAAWETAKDSAALVAVIDSGLDMTHPEFLGRALPGYNYLNPSNPYAMSDDCGHGTHVTGLAAAAFNGQGTVGIAPNVSVLPLKVLGRDINNGCTGSFFNVASAIRYAASSGAAVINVSIEGSASAQDVQDLQSAVDAARAANVLVVAAAGNCAQPNTPGCAATNADSYPAACGGVVAVGATDRKDQWANYSGYKSYLALVAPGGLASDQILSTVPGSGYDRMFGTSMAAPLVAGAAALAWQFWPNAADLGVILRSTADKVGGPAAYDAIGHSDYLGYGRLNAAALVVEAQHYAIPPAVEPQTDPVMFLLGGNRTTQTALVPLTNPSARIATWRVMVTNGGQWLQIVSPVVPDLGRSTHDVPGVLTLRANRGSLLPGDYVGAVLVETVLGTPGSFTLPVSLRIAEPLYQTSLPLSSRP